MANVVSRITPQLTRRNSVISLATPAVRVAIQPSQAKSVPLTDLHRTVQNRPALAKQAVPTRQPIQIKVPPALRPSPSPVLRNQAVIDRKPDLKPQPIVRTRYIGFEIDPDSPAKVANLRGMGENRILVIVGNGPSILEVPLEQLKGHPKIDIMSINKPDSRIWPTSHWAFCDTSQFIRHESLWSTYDGVLITSTAIKRQKPKSMQVINLSGQGFSKNLSDGYYIGQSTVYASMQAAYWMAYKHIYAFGVDMNPEGIDGKLHFYGVNPDVDPAVRKGRFEKEASYYEHAANILTEEERKRYTFCSAYNPWPFVEKFGRLDHRVAVPQILEHANSLMKYTAD